MPPLRGPQETGETPLFILVPLSSYIPLTLPASFPFGLEGAVFLATSIPFLLLSESKFRSAPSKRLSVWAKAG